MFIKLMLAVLYWIGSFLLATHSGAITFGKTWDTSMRNQGYQSHWHADTIWSCVVIMAMVGLALLMTEKG